MRLGDTGIGAVVYFKVSGDDTAFRVMHHGKPNDTYDDSFLNGTILMMHLPTNFWEIAENFRITAFHTIFLMKPYLKLMVL